MKKKLLSLLIAGTMVLSPVCVFADEKDDRIAELEAQVADLQKQLEDALAKIPASTSQSEYKIGETWIVEGQWKVTVDSVEETSDRNEYSEKQPAAVYVLTYTYENLGYQDDYSDGLFISLDDGIVDSAGKMGYSYPGDITMFPQETPISASCQAQVCIGVDNPGNFKINYNNYDGNSQKQSAVFNIEL